MNQRTAGSIISPLSTNLKLCIVPVFPDSYGKGVAGHHIIAQRSLLVLCAVEPGQPVRMGSSDDDGPDDEVSVEIGVTGLILFCILFSSAVVSLKCAKNKYSWRMFACSIVVTLLEIPRYLALIVQRAYVNRGTYILHMWASVAFFAAFTCVIYIMHDAVDLSHAHSPLTVMITSPTSLLDRMVIDKTSLIVVNFLFAALTFAACISCATYSNLENYFHHSIVYRLLTLADMIKNLIVAAAFLFYGCRLKKRINAFYDTFGINPTAGGSVTELDLLMKLRKVVQRLLIVMALCLTSFLLRTAMLTVKGVCIEEESCNLKFLPNYGMLWWTLSDFIPRYVSPRLFWPCFCSRPAQLCGVMTIVHSRCRRLSYSSASARVSTVGKTARPGTAARCGACPTPSPRRRTLRTSTGRPFWLN
jgi:hypothetical protein